MRIIINMRIIIIIVIRLEAESPWMCEIREMWEDTPSAELVFQVP